MIYEGELVVAGDKGRQGVLFVMGLRLRINRKKVDIIISWGARLLSL